MCLFLFNKRDDHNDFPGNRPGNLGSGCNILAMMLQQSVIDYIDENEGRGGEEWAANLRAC